ncbi:MAG: Maf-like protein [Candidatus Kerfeldbacteria bacterium]|nr:Maf-like protein [Candidatus Kerfeldbacteria bacterium]
MKIILGSASTTRKQIMDELGYEYEVMSPDVDEKAIPGEDPKKLTMTLARVKAAALLPQIKEPAVLITADQVVIYDGEIRGKPVGQDEARRFLKSYSNNHTGHINSIVVTNTQTGKTAEDSDYSEVYFTTIPDDIIENFVKNPKIYERAGGFSVRDPLMQKYILNIKGSRESVMGLPVELLKSLISQVS